MARAAAAGVSAQMVGAVGGERVTIGTFIDLSVEEVATRREGALTDALEVL